MRKPNQVEKNALSNIKHTDFSYLSQVAIPLLGSLHPKLTNGIS